MDQRCRRFYSGSKLICKRYALYEPPPAPNIWNLLQLLRDGRAFTAPFEILYKACLFLGAREIARVGKATALLARQAYFGASEFTIFSKRGSPRNGSHIGLRRKLP